MVSVAGAIDRAQRDFRGLAGGDLRLVRRRLGASGRAARRRFPAAARPKSAVVNARAVAAGGAAASSTAHAPRRRVRTLRHWLRIAAGTSKGAVGPAELFRARRRFPRRPSGSPWAFGRAGLRRRAEADGGAAGDQPRLVAVVCALWRARAAICFASWPSTRATFQPAAWKRRTWSVEIGELGRAVDGDVVVVPQHDQLAELADGRPGRSLPG